MCNRKIVVTDEDGKVVETIHCKNRTELRHECGRLRQEKKQFSVTKNGNGHDKNPTTKCRRRSPKGNQHQIARATRG